MAVYCEHCGNQLSEQAVACPACGHPRRSAQQSRAVGVGRLEPYAVVSLVCSIANFVVLPVVGAILGVVFANMAIDRIRQDPGLDGLGMAQAGKIIGYVGIAITLIVLLFMFAVCGAVTATSV